MNQQRHRSLVVGLLTVAAISLASRGGPAFAAADSGRKSKPSTTTIPATTVPPTTTSTTIAPAPAQLVTRSFPVTKSGVTLFLRYCGTKAVDQPNPTIQRLVVVVHGDSRNACDHASYIEQSATAAGVAASTLVVAPHFATADDISASDSSLLYWSDGGWKSGSQSVTSPYARPWTTSSYAVMDLLIQQVASTGTFPNLGSVVVVGHSAGGQFTNRYAAASRVGIDTATGPSYRFVIANPSSYLYLDGRRYHAGVLGPLTAGEVAACPGYDNYKYGLVSPYVYLRDNNAAAIPERYRARNVVYLLGDADTSTTDASLDKSCEGEWQGSQRLERGTLFYQYLANVYGSTVYSTHSKVVVAGIGHDAKGMYVSAKGVAALFG